MLLRSDFTCTGSDSVTSAALGTLRRGMVTLPHGYGLDYPQGDGRRTHGPSVNELTEARHRDPLTATPFHKHVRVRITPIEGS